MHKQLSLENRLENALVGFALLDLGQMLSLEKEKELGCKPGRCFFDPVTIRNLKDLVGGVAIMAYTLPAGYCFRPWSMCELPIEEFFGMLRGQFTSSQMSTRDYLRASARCSEQTVRKLASKGSDFARAPATTDRKLTEEEFRQCGRKALDAALELMVLCCDYTKAQLKRSYAAFTVNRCFVDEQDLNGDEEDDEAPDMCDASFYYDEDDDECVDIRTSKTDHADKDDKDDKGKTDDKGEKKKQVLKGADKECFSILKQIQAREAEEKEGEHREKRMMKSLGADAEEALRLGTTTPATRKVHLLDESDMQAGWNADDGVPEASEDRSADMANRDANTLPRLPKTGVSTTRSLYTLFQHPTVQEDMKATNGSNVWMHLWRLLVRLRADDGQGCDARFLKNHRNCRWMSQRLNWHQQGEHACALLNAQSGLSANRTSRAAAWKAVAASAAQKILNVDESKLPVSLCSGIAVLFLAPLKQPCWRVALVLSCWTLAGKKVKPSHLPVPMNRVHSVRVVLMDPAQNRPEGTFRADERCIVTVSSPFRVALYLDCCETTAAPTHFECRLTQECLEAVQKAHLLTKWPKNLLEEVAKDANIAPAKTSTAASPKKPKSTKGTKQMNSPKIDTGGSGGAHPDAAPVPLHDQKDVDKKNAKTVKIIKGSMIKNGKGKKKEDDEDGPTIVPGAFRRSSEGDRAIKQQMRQLYKLAEAKFSAKPLVNESGAFNLPGLENVSWEELVQRAPQYFSACFTKIRGIAEYGHAVFNVLEKCYTELNSDPPVRKAWANLLINIPRGSVKPWESEDREAYNIVEVLGDLDDLE
eukprot:Skav220634  [mRNA]  locus=scaffold112:439052:442517:- [translate_table: standard]